MNLDFMPSPDPERPGLVIRDPYHYSDATLMVPMPLVPALDCFDGEHTSLDLRSDLVRLTGRIQVSDIERNLHDSLDQAGFFENETSLRMRREKEAEFAGDSVRPAIFAGTAYPDQPDELSELMRQRIGGAQGEASTVAIAAPHATPDGGWETYRAAYQAMPSPEAAQDMTIVILGTSHYGAPDRFGLTRKPYVTPYGVAPTDVTVVDELIQGAPEAVRLEDYCHAVEHSIEFQVIFLQHLYGPSVRIVPVLCGPFVRSTYEKELPEANEHVQRFFDTASNIAARKGKRLFWLLGVDMAHIGRRYGDRLDARANAGEMLSVKDRDQQLIAQLKGGDPDAYWSLIQEHQDELKWCGASPFYTLLKILPRLKGQLLDYNQWQIDPQSVVSFGALRFEAA
jgi:AmmeMemoRadiSam system protein B